MKGTWVLCVGIMGVLIALLVIYVGIENGGSSFPASPQAAPLVQINESEMYVSSNPIRTGENVIFEMRPTKETLAFIEKELIARDNSSQRAIRPVDSTPVLPKQDGEHTRNLVCCIAIKQDRVMLYESSNTVNAENLEQSRPVSVVQATGKIQLIRMAMIFILMLAIGCMGAVPKTRMIL